MNLGFSDFTPKESRRRLLAYANEIEHKFDEGRASDISPEMLGQIVQVCIKLRKQSTARRLQAQLADLEAQCYAGQIDYANSATRAEYFKRLRFVSSLIRRLEDV